MNKTIVIAMIVLAVAWRVLLAGEASPPTQPAGAPSPASQLPKELKLDLGNKVAVKLVLIPAGKFLMGSPESDRGRSANEGLQHEVKISDPYYMGVTAVTQSQWAAVMGTTVAQQRDRISPSWPLFGEGPDHPMYYVSWDDATAFCKKLTRKAGRKVVLPTEAQWEYACRAGTSTRFSYGDDDEYGKLGDVAWYDKNSDGQAHPVGRKTPNEFGLYDMHGNVREWCADWYRPNYNANASNADPPGPASGTSHVLRGAAWGTHAMDCRSASRSGGEGDDRPQAGFRLVVLTAWGADDLSDDETAPGGQPAIEPALKKTAQRVSSALGVVHWRQLQQGAPEKDFRAIGVCLEARQGLFMFFLADPNVPTAQLGNWGVILPNSPQTILDAKFMGNDLVTGVAFIQVEGKHGFTEAAFRRRSGVFAGQRVASLGIDLAAADFPIVIGAGAIGAPPNEKIRLARLTSGRLTGAGSLVIDDTGLAIGIVHPPTAANTKWSREFTIVDDFARSLMRIPADGKPYSSPPAP